jgi:hypothetical protein
MSHRFDEDGYCVTCGGEICCVEGRDCVPDASTLGDALKIAEAEADCPYCDDRGCDRCDSTGSCIPESDHLQLLRSRNEELRDEVAKMQRLIDTQREELRLLRRAALRWIDPSALRS